MDKNCLAYGIEIPDSDWEKTPPSVKQLVEKMGQFTKELEKKLTDLEAKQQELLEKINRTSKNSSSPPSSDPLNAEKKKEKKKSGLKRGGQPGHKGHSRFLYDVSECESVLEHHPLTCSCCGEKLEGEDGNPYRHQYYSVKHFELRIWFGEKVFGVGLKVFSSPFPLPLFPKTRQVLGRVGTTTTMLGTFKKRIHQNIRAGWSFPGYWKCSGQINSKFKIINSKLKSVGA